jgi:hypothetical protein
MPSQRSPVRPTVRDHDPGRDARSRPSPAGRDVRSQSPLSVDRAHQVVEIHDLGLELEDQQTPCRGVPGEPVDHASLAIRRERDLRLESPARKLPKALRDRFVDGRVTSVDQAPEVASLPPKGEIHARIKGRGDRAQIVDPNAGILPRSIRPTSDRGTPATMEISSCVRPARIRMDFSADPSRGSSIR